MAYLHLIPPNYTILAFYCLLIEGPGDNYNNIIIIYLPVTQSSPFYLPSTPLLVAPRTFMQQRRCNYSTGKRWTTAFLLSFTVGGLGIDRFYLNHWASACGKLISFGGLGVWSILDVILVGTGYLGPADGSAYIY